MMSTQGHAPDKAAAPRAHGQRLLFGRQALDSIAALNTPGAGYWRFVLEEGAGALAPNLTSEAGVLRHGSSFVPVTMDRDEPVSSYPCSLLTQYVRYPLGEMRLLKGVTARYGARLGLGTLGAVLAGAGVGRVVQWNSWLMSTNLFSPPSLGEILQTTSLLAQQFPQYPILVKNLHDHEDTNLTQRFIAAGYDLFPSRKIYFFDGGAARFLSKTNVRQDVSALRKLKSHARVEHHEFTVEDSSRILRLYQMLYLEKHSPFNPAYTVSFIRRALVEGLLEFRGLRHSSGRIDAFLASFRRGNVAATPLVGYDTLQRDRPDYYRLLVAMLLTRTAEEGTLLNYSSGAGEFKRRRGGEGCVEYNALYSGHLSNGRRLIFACLGRALRAVGGPVFAHLGV